MARSLERKWKRDGHMVEYLPSSCSERVALPRLKPPLAARKDAQEVDDEQHLGRDTPREIERTG